MASQSTITAASFQVDIQKDITTAEIYITTFIAEHKLPFHAADHVTMLCKVMFPDSKTAAQWCLLQAEPRQLSLLSVLLYQHLMLKYLKSASLHLLHFCVMVVMTKWARSILESWCDIGVKWHISQ